MVLERNPDWWGGEPPLDRVVVDQVSDPQARAQLALSRQADIVLDVPSERAEEIDQAPGIRLASTNAANTVAVYLNPGSRKSPALADSRVRQALAWAIDRQEVTRLATNGLTTPAPSWLASSPAYPEAKQRGYTSYDPNRAGALLDQAGWRLRDGVRTKGGRALTLRLLTFGSEGPTGEVLQAQWTKLGIRVDARNVDDSLVIQVLESGDWDAVTQAWTTLGDPAALLGGQISADGAGNHAGLDLPEVPRLLQRAASSPDEATRDQAVYRLNQVMIESVPSIPVHPRVVASAVSADVVGFVDHPLQYEQVVTGRLALRSR
jgi:peptide/nickel transport system substrate-binding protein